MHNYSLPMFRTTATISLFLLVWLSLGCTSKENKVETQLPAETVADNSGKVMLDLGAHQQTTEYTCGPAAVLTLLQYFGKTADELAIAEGMGTNPVHGTSPEQMAEWLSQNGFKAAWQEHGSLEILRENLSKGKPTLVEWSDWGGHWVLVIGYDTRGTTNKQDDVIYFADPYDRYDGNPDGVTSFNAERFYYMWYDALLFDRVMNRVYIAIE